jgi:hypothetical protein
MIARIFKVIWIISLISVSVVFFYTYAALRSDVNLGVNLQSFNKETFFYLTVALIGVFNMLVFPVERMLKSEFNISWFYGLLTCLHFFLISILIMLTVINSNEKYDYDNLGPILILSFALFSCWILALPVRLIFVKFFPRSE